MIELLVVLAIIALLVGLLLPALSVVRNTAKETKQKAQFATIELALVAFKNDYGDYPPSRSYGGPVFDYTSGSQALAEALLGWDLLGFHPNSAWRADGLDAQNGPWTYDPAQTRDNNPQDNIPDTFDERKGPYLELVNIGAFRLGNISVNKPGMFIDTAPLHPDTFVLCDVFGGTKVMMPNGRIVQAGAPILYYRANTFLKRIRGVYNVYDNDTLVVMKQQADGRLHPLADTTNQYQFFYGPVNPTVGIVGYIQDPKIEARVWPYRPDSYILISAGADGLYGTPDDIRNFGN